MRTYIAIAALALVAGCGGSGDVDAGEVPEVTQEAPQDDEGATTEPEGAPVDMESWEREYDTPDDIVAALQGGGVECETDSPSAPTAYSLRGVRCHVGDDYYGVNVYGSPEQQGEANEHFLSDASWAGTTFVWGIGWSVSVPFESDGSEVVAAVGGEVFPG